MLRCQLFIRFWMLVITQFQERFTSNDTTRLQAQPFSASTNPMTMFCFSLGVIIIMGQVFVEISLRFCGMPLNMVQHFMRMPSDRL